MFLKLIITLITFASPSLVQIELKSLQNKSVYINNFEQFDATTLWFISPECPLCQNYTLTIKNIKKKYGNSVRVIGIVSGKYFSIKEVEQFKKDYNIELDVYFDYDKKLAKYLGASITPEVFVFNKKSELVYSGRIDNWAYAPGKKRAVITKHELDDVLLQLKQGTKFTYFKTQAIGCFIE
jgi:thiol-disulfide isomerase/thioredoxin